MALDREAGRLKIDWTRLRGFADWAAQHPDALADAIADPPARTGTPLDAVLAAFAEQLADEADVGRPRWTRAVGALREPWAPPATRRMRAAAQESTPEPCRRRVDALARTESADARRSAVGVRLLPPSSPIRSRGRLCDHEPEARCLPCSARER